MRASTWQHLTASQACTRRPTVLAMAMQSVGLAAEAFGLAGGPQWARLHPMNSPQGSAAAEARVRAPLTSPAMPIATRAGVPWGRARS